ncbi:MAG: PDGLE domain-containing protein [Thermodesulfobacteriota bacterium]
MTPLQKKLWLGLVIMALLTPLGLILPELFEAGEAWGEWGIESLEKLLGYIPEGLKKMSELWKAPIPDYIFGYEEANLTKQVIFYLISGLIGVVMVGGVVYLISRFWIKHER